MRRKRSLPWIYRWSRYIIGAIAVVGIFLTAYLTIVKLTGTEVACGVNPSESGVGCNDVLNSPYAVVFGLPLSLYGLMAYLSMGTFALGPLFISLDKNKKLRQQLENWSWLFLLMGATAMAVFSFYLMYILATKIQTTCLYCIGSALFSLTLLILTIIGKEWEDLGQIFFTGVTVALVTLVGTLGVYANVNKPATEVNNTIIDGRIAISSPSSYPEPPIGWEITTISGDAEIALAKHLTAIGAKNYGAFWCPHCYEQKQLFGKEAFSQIDYIECEQQGKNSRPDLCVAAGIKSYPSWEINGQFYSGTQTLEKLAQVSDYQGNLEFKYIIPGR